ncbi:MAG TPA: LLM class F420-dependent oxidoreductase [Chloroflexia bacterium]|nr:LLM class F420-dependent oxidoreductase [Chloroflexia bacterium]
MKLGLQQTYFTYPGGPPELGATFKRMVQDAEAAGLYSFWVMDHFFQLRGWGPKEREMLEGYSALSYAAATTSKIKLGTLVTGVTYRHPAILIKTATTLDVLSGGRAYFGVGAAWYEVEHAGLGVPFPPLKERFEVLEETLQLAHQMWSGEVAPFEGQHLHLAEALNSPNTVQNPHPPILIGGDGEQKTFRLIAKYGDACNIIVITGPNTDPIKGVEFGARKFAVLRERCDEIGRPYSEIEKTTLSGLIVTRDGKEPDTALPRPEAQTVMTPSQAIEYFHQLAEIGTDHAIFNSAISHVPGAFDVWAEEIIPAVEKFVPAGR